MFQIQEKIILYTKKLLLKQGFPIDFTNVDDKAKKWIAEFSSKSCPDKLETIDPMLFSALLFPNSPGALSDLVSHDTVMHILRNFVKHQSKICS